MNFSTFFWMFLSLFFLSSQAKPTRRIASNSEEIFKQSFLPRMPSLLLPPLPHLPVPRINTNAEGISSLNGLINTIARTLSPSIQPVARNIIAQRLHANNPLVHIFYNTTMETLQSVAEHQGDQYALTNPETLQLILGEYLVRLAASIEQLAEYQVTRQNSAFRDGAYKMAARALAKTLYQFGTYLLKDHYQEFQGTNSNAQKI